MSAPLADPTELAPRQEASPGTNSTASGAVLRGSAVAPAEPGGVSGTPYEHFKLLFFAAVQQVVDQVVVGFGSLEAALQQFPFLAGYRSELDRQAIAVGAPLEAAAIWRDTIAGWQAPITAHLPLRALARAAALEHLDLTLLIATGLAEEDGRFGLLCDALSGMALQRPTFGLLSAWWRPYCGEGGSRAALRRLIALGLVHVANPEAPRNQWALQPVPEVWDALTGERRSEPCPWAALRTPEQLTSLEALILSDDDRAQITRLPALLASGDVQALIVRGGRGNGRRTAIAAVARELGLGVLETSALRKSDDGRWRTLGALATMLHALPVAVLDLAPGETVEVPRLAGYNGPLALVLGGHGGVVGPGVERAVGLALALPAAGERRRHWLAGAEGTPISELDAVADGLRMGGGRIRQAARLAKAHAVLAGRPAVARDDVRKARRFLTRQALETLATPLADAGDWSRLVVGGSAEAELATLLARCRNREHLAAAAGPALAGNINAGVRALFTGPSGTGKTLAARLLGGALGLDVYRLDLSAVVNKYIGETEKNLERILSLAEELDVVLLIDEGDALLTQRTSVQSANDRYANLETNFLLQRLESFHGVVVITTNAGDRIDNAFLRRMDVVVEFRAPNAAERLRIWQMHLPPSHGVDGALLSELAGGCPLAGGQIRNAALHATVLALEEGGSVTTDRLLRAVQREYRKSGAMFPLRSREP